MDVVEESVASVSFAKDSISGALGENTSITLSAALLEDGAAAGWLELVGVERAFTPEEV